MVDIRNQVGTKRAIHAGVWRFHRLPPSSSRWLFCCRLSWGRPLQPGRKQKRGIKRRSIRGNPGRNRCENVRRWTFCREKKACGFVDLPDFPAFQKNLLTGFSRTVTLPAPSFSSVTAFRMRFSASSLRALLRLRLNAHECPRLQPVLISHNEF